MDQSEDVDFDFFDTPRNDVSESPAFARSVGQNSVSQKRVEKISDKTADAQRKQYRAKGEESDDSYSSDGSSVSDSESETPRVQRPSDVKKPNGIPRGKMLPESSESSSAYSDSESDSAGSHDSAKGNGDRQKTNISVTLPKTAQAWGAEERSDRKDHLRKEERRDTYQPSRKRREPDRKNSSNMKTAESDSDSSHEHHRYKEKPSGDKKRSATCKTKSGAEKTDKQSRQPLKSTSSNNSDITDVSPLESPDVSPRETRKRYNNVQYADKNTSGGGADIRLDSDKIDLSILMKCMADIDREKQQRLKANSRRVMFAPTSHHDKPKTNYTYSASRARMIEKENQRLLQQIMHHVQPGSKKLNPGVATKSVPKKAVEPVVQRLTPSAVNRQREQRKIEMENMQFLKRLQTVRATKGMSRQDQLSEFEKQASYGMPTCIIPTNTGHFDYSLPYRETHSHMSGTRSVGQTQRSRPSSAKSNLSTTGRRSRPSSAKSNASIRSNASVRSNMSIRSGTSTLRGKERPAWDDRFAYS